MVYRLKHPLAQTVAYNLASQELEKPEYQELNGQGLLQKHQELYAKYYFKLIRKSTKQLKEMLEEQRLKRKKVKQPSEEELENLRIKSLIQDFESKHKQVRLL